MKPYKKSKYRSRKVTIDGVKYDSVKEYERWCQLKRMEQAGIISGLHRQVKYILIPKQRIDGKIVERECCYIADHVYYKNGQFIVEDVKGFKTPDYIIKRKLMLHVYGIRIYEV